MNKKTNGEEMVQQSHSKKDNALKQVGQKLKWLQAKPDEEAQKDHIWTSEAA